MKLKGVSFFESTQKKLSFLACASFIYLFIYLFIHLFIYSFIYLFIYLFIHFAAENKYYRKKKKKYNYRAGRATKIVQN